MKKLGDSNIEWPKSLTMWVEGRSLNVSVSFTWDLPKVNALLAQQDFMYDHIVVGGPAVRLMPNFFIDSIVEGECLLAIGDHSPGVLQRVNPLATRTSVGCIRNCGFCAVPKTEGQLVELSGWPDLPIICDNNLLACSQKHFDKVMDLLERHEWCDFNQGVDSRLLTSYHAGRFRRLRNPLIRLALDNMKYSDQWTEAMGILLAAKIPKSHIRSYALIAFGSDPDEAWGRCEFIEKQGIKALPMWFHSLDCLKRQAVSVEQKELGWNDYERRRILQWFYQHKKARR